MRMRLPEEMEVGQMEEEGWEEVLGVRRRGLESEWEFVLQGRVKEDFHSVKAEERRPLKTVSSV